MCSGFSTLLSSHRSFHFFLSLSYTFFSQHIKIEFTPSTTRNEFAGLNNVSYFCSLLLEYKMSETTMQLIARKLFSLFFLACGIFMDTAQGQVTADFTTFGVTSGCSPLVVKFKDLSTPANKVTWQWSFGNSNSSTQKNPIAIYVTPGKYTVTLTVKDSTDTTISNTITKTAFITVFAKPVTEFSANPTGGCPPQTVQFSDLTQKGDTGIKTWLWDFGDGQKDVVKNPVHTFPTGSYTITLVT